MSNHVIVCNFDNKFRGQEVTPRNSPRLLFDLCSGHCNWDWWIDTRRKMNDVGWYLISFESLYFLVPAHLAMRIFASACVSVNTQFYRTPTKESSQITISGTGAGQRDNKALWTATSRNQGCLDLYYLSASFIYDRRREGKIKLWEKLYTEKPLRQTQLRKWNWLALNLRCRMSIRCRSFCGSDVGVPWYGISERSSRRWEADRPLEVTSKAELVGALSTSLQRWPVNTGIYPLVEGLTKSPFQTEVFKHLSNIFH